jgi:hypothetical protein
MKTPHPYMKPTLIKIVFMLRKCHMLSMMDVVNWMHGKYCLVLKFIHHHHVAMYRFQNCSFHEARNDKMGNMFFTSRY